MTVSPAPGEDQPNGHRRHVLVLAYITAIGGLITALAAVLALVLR
jgi:hypothetical protein